VHIDAKAIAHIDSDFSIYAAISVDGNMDNESMHLIQYNHIPTLQYFTKATAKVVKPTWKCTVKRIGYIAGPGDDIPRY